MKNMESQLEICRILTKIFSLFNLVYSTPSVYGPPLPVFEAITFVLSEH